MQLKATLFDLSDKTLKLAKVSPCTLIITTKSLPINQYYNNHFAYFCIHISHHGLKYSDFKPFELKNV